MTDLVVLLVLAVVVALVGIGAGILVARPLDRFVSREDEGPDDPEGIPVDGAREAGVDRRGPTGASMESEEDA